jgi:hypothetical protein
MIETRGLFAIGAACSLLLFLACGEVLNASPLPEPAEAGPDGADVQDATAVGPNDAGDASAPAFDLSFRAPCPRPKAPGTACTDAPSGCKRTRVHQPTPRNRPFGIAVDARHVFWLAQPLTDLGYDGHAPATLFRLDRLTFEVVELARDQQGATKLYAHGPDLFWAAEALATYELRSVRKDASPCNAAGCSAPRVVSGALGKLAHIGAAVENDVFVVQVNGAIFHVSVDQVTPSKLPLGGTTTNPGFVAGQGGVFASGYDQASVLRFNTNGIDGGIIGTIPKVDDATGPGTALLATSCDDVYAVVSGNRVQIHPAGANGGSFTAFGSIPMQVPILSIGSDARFLYYGGANATGLYRVDVQGGGPAQLLTTGSIWELDVSDDVVAFGEHGLSGPDQNEDIGSIFLIEK